MMSKQLFKFLRCGLADPAAVGACTSETAETGSGFAL